jgi:hypothetical protein
MFAIAGIVLLLFHLALSAARVHAVDALPLPAAPLGAALLAYLFVVDVRLRKAELVASPLAGWALALAGWCALRMALSPAATWPAAIEAAVPVVLFLALAHGVQRFAAIGVVAATLIVLAVVAPALRFDDDPVGHTLTLAAATPLAFAYVSRNRSPLGVLLVLAALAALVVCVVLTRSRAVHFTYGLRERWDWPTIVLGALLVLGSLRIARAVLREHADDPDAAVACTWARALRVALVVVAASCALAPAAAAGLVWIFGGLAGALYQATRAHDPHFVLRAYNGTKR